jgi:hypothetical protein
MIKLDAQHLLFIHPSGETTPEPVVDALTAKMQELFAKARRVATYRGRHTCACGQHSDSSDWQLASGHITNSLAIHYVAWHRPDVPESELEKLRAI